MINRAELAMTWKELCCCVWKCTCFLGFEYPFKRARTGYKFIPMMLKS